MPKEIREPRVQLVSHTKDPLETVFSIWDQSKSMEPVKMPDEIKRTHDPEDVRALFRAIAGQRIPVADHLDFIFVLSDVTVAFREQMVRHRVGTLPSAERVGIDMEFEIVPEKTGSSWWSQSMVIQDMGDYADRSSYVVPESVHGREDTNELVAKIDEVNLYIQEAYKFMTERGVPREDARMFIPLGALHRISWKLNMSALIHIVSKRSCWILQLSYWGPIIRGIINELATKVDPVFRELVNPPCITTNTDGSSNFSGCKFMEENRRRTSGQDEMPPCPLHIFYHQGRTPDEVEVDDNLNEVEEYRRKLPLYREFWGRDPYTGERNE
jgi:thymidylate synthase ThyX